MIGDIFERGAQNLVDAINKLPPGSGKACWKKCDVARWDEQVALFEFAMTRFGGVDIVVSAAFSGRALSGSMSTGHPYAWYGWQVAGARIGELQNIGTPQVGADGKPIKPHLKTLNVNLIGAIYSASSSSPRCLESSRFTFTTATQLALHYLPRTWSPCKEPLRYIVFLGFSGTPNLVVATNSDTI